MIRKGRAAARALAATGLTFGLYGALELETRITEAAEHDPLMRKWIERYGRALLRVFNLEVIARGRHVERGERYAARDAQGRGRVFIMNHRSALDIPVTLAHFEASIVSRADLSGWPVIGPAARRVGTLFVERGDKHSGRRVLQAVAAELAAGRGVMLYPEGTTHEGDEVRPFKAGAFRAAQLAGAEIVPVGIAYDDPNAAFGDETFAQHITRMSEVARSRSAIVVGDPLRVSPDENGDSVVERARGIVQGLVNDARRLL